MNSRGAKLQDEKIFYKAIMDNKSDIDRVKKFHLQDFCNENKTIEIGNITSNLFEKLELTKNSKFVTLSKTLHFLHPQLMIPMDRTYTANYFHDFRMPDIPSNLKKQSEWNLAFHKELCMVYLNHQELINTISIETKYPVTKLLDNMLIGFSMY